MKTQSVSRFFTMLNTEFYQERENSKDNDSDDDRHGNNDDANSFGLQCLLHPSQTQSMGVVTTTYRVSNLHDKALRRFT